MFDILIVEDNNELSNLLNIFLTREGYSTSIASSGEEAIAFLQKEKIKLLLLDIMLPGIDGFAICQSVRQDSDIPIIIMSAKIDKEDKMNGYHLGADDYIEKPVDIDILIARVGALMRRNYSLKSQSSLLHSGAITIDKENLKAYFHDQPIQMTTKEFELLLLLVENPGKALSKDFLFNQIWGIDSFSENQTLTVHVKMLRDKVEEDSKNPKRIQTVWGTGYRYEEI